MVAVFKREIKAYFFSPLGYIFIGVVFFFTGYLFYTYNLFAATTDASSAYSRLFIVMLFMTPILTMRLLSEERGLKTERQLFASPLSRGQIVLGKYFSAIFIYAVSISYSLINAAIISIYGKPDWPAIFGSYAGLLLLGCALAAVCLFLSSFTGSQFISVVFGFCAALFLMLIDAISLLIGDGALQRVLLAVSFNNRYAPFASGILDVCGIVYFLSVAALFVSLTAVMLDKRRWS